MGKQTRKRPKEDIRDLDIKPIPDLHGYYITKEGRVFSVMELTPYKDQDGYKRVHVFPNKKHKRPGLHVLLAKTFLPAPKEDQTVVRHLDDDKENTSLSNLAWGTHFDNGLDKAKNGIVKGENNPRAKLTTDQVKNIKQKLKTNTIKQIAEEFNWVSRSTIEAISSGQNWSHVNP